MEKRNNYLKYKNILNNQKYIVSSKKKVRILTLTELRELKNGIIPILLVSLSFGFVIKYISTEFNNIDDIYGLYFGLGIFLFIFLRFLFYYLGQISNIKGDIKMILLKPNFGINEIKITKERNYHQYYLVYKK